ncbi:hypothetical protein FBU30_003332, partial [Linnemannia zychae]
MAHIKQASNKWSHYLDAVTNPRAGYDGIREDVLRMLQKPTQTEQETFVGCVTLHFMYADYNMKTLAIAMVSMEQSQTAEYLCEELQKIVDDWGLRGKL